MNFVKVILIAIDILWVVLFTWSYTDDGINRDIAQPSVLLNCVMISINLMVFMP